jgi:SWI/SNF-related matrix-associated actin-dependent regulator 1 of chromatin subfamily A
MDKEFYIDNVNKTVNLMFEYDELLIKQIKSCDYNSRWNSEHKQWIIPVNAYSKPRILNIVKSHQFKQVEIPIEDEVEVCYEQTEVDYAYLKGLCDGKGFTYQPRKYQLEALAYGLEKGNIINGDDVGLGKTFEAIMYAETTNSFPCLVIVPASVKYNWKEKWLEITNNKRTVSAIESTPKKKSPNNWNADVVIINYDIIGKKWGEGATVKFDELIQNKWEMIIFDEAHFLKEKTSQRAIAAKRIASVEAKIQMLTGTAVMSRPVELWNLLVLAKRDHLIAKDWHQFITRYCGGYRSKFGWVADGATHTLELNRRLREACYIRREKRDVLVELPDIMKQVIQIPITNKREIDLALIDFIKYIRDTKGDEKAESAMEAEHLVALSVMRKLSIEGKLKGIELYLRDWKQAENGKLLIFGLHREPLEYLSTKFKSKLIAGGVSSLKKQEIVKEWIEDDNMFLFANMQSAGTGVDGLQLVCSNMLILELPWRPSDLSQAMGRLDRSGQKSSTTVSFMLSDDTIDSQMWDMLADKEEVTEAVNKGKDIKKQGSGMAQVIKKLLKKSSK